MYPHAEFGDLWLRLNELDREVPHFIGLDDAESDFANITNWYSDQMERRQKLVHSWLSSSIKQGRHYIDETLGMWVGCIQRDRLYELVNKIVENAWDDDRTEIVTRSLAQVMFTRATARAFYRQVEVESDVGRARDNMQVLRNFKTLIGGMKYSIPDFIDDKVADYALTLTKILSKSNASSLAKSGGNATVIVHGTWASGETWWRDQKGAGLPLSSDNLWAYLQNCGIHDLVGYGNEFVWSGGNTVAARRQGARDFINWWHSQGNPTLRVVAHSHGGNVVLLACMMEPAIEIESLVMLGTPVRILYVPRASQIEKLHNVYSRHDLIQFGGSYGGKRGEGRTQSDHATAINYHLPDMHPGSFGVAPVGHADLHNPTFWKNHKLEQLL